MTGSLVSIRSFLPAVSATWTSGRCHFLCQNVIHIVDKNLVYTTRIGGPPSDQCGGTNGDNEVWNLAKEPAHYRGKPYYLLNLIIITYNLVVKLFNYLRRNNR